MSLCSYLSALWGCKCSAQHPYSLRWTAEPSSEPFSFLGPLLPCSTAAAAKSLQSCPTLCDPIDGSPRGSSVSGILQARVLEWDAIAFSTGSPQLQVQLCISLKTQLFFFFALQPLSFWTSGLEGWLLRQRDSLQTALWFWPLLSAGFSEQLLERAQHTVFCGHSFTLLFSLLIWSIFFFKTKSFWETQNINDIKLRSRFRCWGLKF